MEDTTFRGGSLRSYYDNWQTIISNPVILDWIQNGVKLPFYSYPNAFEETNRQFNAKEIEFLDKEITSLLRADVIQISHNRPHCVSRISVVPKKKDSFRLIVDLQQLNLSCVPKSIVYENIEDVAKSISVDDQLVTIDIKNGFYHVPVHKDHEQFLGFKWKDTYYVFKVLPMGSNCSPYFFCKILRSVIEYLRSQDINLSCYVDDIIITDHNEKIYDARDFVIKTLGYLGYYINYDKSQLTPTKHKEYIGYIINTNKGGNVWLEIPKCRVVKVKHDIKRIVQKGEASARALARVAGQLISFSRAVIPTKLLLRSIYRLIKTRCNWQSILQLNTECQTDLEWWLASLSAWNGRSVCLSNAEKIQITTDASAIGWGGAIVTQPQEAQGFWNPDIARSSSNSRELMAVLLSLRSFLPLISRKNVQVLTDNITTAAYINLQGGSNKLLSEIATEIWSLSIRNNFLIQAKYIQGKHNIRADGLSRLRPHYEWQLHPGVFQYIDKIFGPHTIDRFASFMNSHCRVYNSLFLDPGTSGIDALQQRDWGGENNFVNCPIRLLGKVVEIIRSQKALATIIAPMWKAQRWFHNMKNMLICPPIRLPSPKLLCLPLRGFTPEPVKNPKWRLYAWRVYGGKN